MTPDDMDRILLIHPGPKARDQLTFLLQHSAFQAPTAVDADQALAQVSRRHPDLILMADTVAKTNGDEPYIRVRELCEAPIVVLGEEHQQRAGIHFSEVRADVYMPHPLNLRLLLVWVRSLLQRSKATAQNFQTTNSPTNSLFNEGR